MAKKEIMIVADYTQENPISFEELCEICDISADFIHTLIEYEIIHPAGMVPEEWIFDVTHLTRVKTAVRLQRDLEVNVAGIAVVLDLLDELKQLREYAELLEKHIKKS